MVDRSRFAWLLCAALSVFSVGCVSDPTINMGSARVAKIDDTGVTITMTMNIKNDNSFDVLVRDVKANVILDGVHFLPPIKISPNSWLPSNTTTPLQIPVLVPWSVANYILQSGAPTIAYRARGIANVTGSRTLKVESAYPIDQQGTITRAELDTSPPK